MWIKTSPRLHGTPGGKARDCVGGDTIVLIVLSSQHLSPVGVVSRQVKEVNTREDDKKTAKQRDCAHSISGVEAFKKNERSTQRSGCECDIIQWIDSEPIVSSGFSNTGSLDSH